MNIQIKEFLLYHYKLSQRDDSNFWNYFKPLNNNDDNKMLEQLEAKKDEFKFIVNGKISKKTSFKIFQLISIILDLQI